MPNNQKKMTHGLMRLLVFVAVAVIHLLLILFLAFNVQAGRQEEAENARLMKLTDLDEAPPPPPPPPEAELPQVEAIAETMIETDTPPMQSVVAPGTLITSNWDDYLPAHKVSETPHFDEKELASAIVYPPIAHRSGIEGRVILELFIDQNGLVQQIRILREEPKERGFGEAAVKAFTGRRCVPARANGQPVSCRYRYPVTFKIK